MYRNFIISAWRNLAKYKVYAVINFTGLAVGMALVLLIFSYLRSELSYDRFHDKADRLYRLSYLVPNGMKLALTPPPIAPLMTDFFPEVEQAARLYSRNVSIDHREGSKTEAYEETDVIFADSAIMKMFTFTFLSGNPKEALREPYTLLITEEMAKKYFGNRDPLGESLVLGGKQPFRVAGVVKNFPRNSHLRFHMLVPYDNMFDLESADGAERMRKNLTTNFIISHGYTYVLLKPGGRSDKVDEAMASFLKKHCPPNRMVGQVFTMMPLTDIHLQSTLQGEPTSTNSASILFIFGGVGFLTLIIACFNYINLSTAQSFARTREIGIRKILGSARYQLIGQFMGESFFFCLVSWLFSFGLVYMAIPLLNQYTGQELVFSELLDASLWLLSFMLLLVVTLLAGGYPAYFVSQFKSVTALKGEGGPAGSSQFLRKAMVVFQLTIACMLLCGSMLLVKQLNYLKNLPLGFSKTQVVSIPLFSQNMNAIFSGADSTFRSRLRTFQDRIEQQVGVIQTTVSSAAPGTGAIYRGAIPEGFSQEDNLFVGDLSVDYDFIKTFDISMAAGRAFSRDFGSDPAEGFIVNEQAVQQFHWGTPEQALGKTMDREGKKGKIIGVVKDFNMESLTTPISALILELNEPMWNTLSVKLNNQDAHALTELMKSEWNKIFPEKAFEFSFLDEQLNQQYSNYQNFGKIIQWFTGIAMIISCLGVFGLVQFVVQGKVKEIGVRKVLGAHVAGILRLIYKDFLWLALLGFVFAIPVSWYLSMKWLENFTYHTQIDALTYCVSLMLVLLVVAVTISYHALRAAFANPVKSLRSE